jgi:phage-related protein
MAHVMSLARPKMGFLRDISSDIMSFKPLVWIGDSLDRVHSGKAYRVVYIATFAEAVYVLHAFEKRSRKAPKLDVELARNRLRRLIQERGSR